MDVVANLLVGLVRFNGLGGLGWVDEVVVGCCWAGRVG